MYDNKKKTTRWHRQVKCINQLICHEEEFSFQKQTSSVWNISTNETTAASGKKQLLLFNVMKIIFFSELWYIEEHQAE